MKLIYFTVASVDLIPFVLLDHMSQLYDVFALLVFLTRLERVLLSRAETWIVRIVNCVAGGEMWFTVLTYFHPSGVLQHSQKMSATAWRPVSRTRSSACPQATLTLWNGMKKRKNGCVKKYFGLAFLSFTTKKAYKFCKIRGIEFWGLFISYVT